LVNFEKFWFSKIFEIIYNLEQQAGDKFAKMGLQTLAFAVLPLASHFIGTDGPTMSFTGSGKFTNDQLQS